MIEHAHRRMDRIERHLKHRYQAPTVPQYDLQAPVATAPTNIQVFEANVTDLTTPPYYLPGGPTIPCYVQCDIQIPSATITLLDSHSDTFSANMISVALPIKTALFLDKTSGSWKFGSYFSSSTIAPVLDAWFKVDLHIQSTGIDWYINDTLLYTDTYSVTNSSCYFGATAPSELGEIYYFDNVKTGSTYGANDLGGTDFSDPIISDYPGAGFTRSIVNDPLGTGGPDI